MTNKDRPANRLGKTALRSAMMGLCFSGVGIGASLAGECDCDTCCRKTSLPQIQLPKAPCLGSGLFDHFNRMSSRIGAKFHHRAGNVCDDASDCETGCDEACDVCSEDNADSVYSSQATLHYGDSDSGVNVGDTFESQPGSWRFEESSPSRPMAKPIPAVPTPVPTPARPGNPFLDEARFTPKPSRLPGSITRQEVHIAKLNASTGPTKTASSRKQTGELMATEADSQVIHVGATLLSENDEHVRFAR